MVTTGTSIHELVRAGRFQDVVAAHANTLSSLSTSDRLHVAEALARKGRLSQAQAVVEDSLRFGDEASTSPRAEMILGIVSRDRGLIAESIGHLRQSARLAREHELPAQEAESLLTLFRLLAEREPPESVSHLLTTLRKATTRVGDPHLTALLHDSVGRWEAQVGHVDEARRHLRIVSGILQSFPNAWLEQLYEISCFCVEFSNCSFDLAEQHLMRAESLSDLSGALEDTIANNLGHLYLQTGQFDRAERILKPLLESSVSDVSQSSLDGLARLYLSTGRLDECTRAIETLRAAQETDRSSFPTRSRLITGVRLALRKADWQLARTAASEALAEANRVGDKQTTATALLLQARALAELGENREASHSLCNAVMSGAWEYREQQGLFAHLCSELQRGLPYLQSSSKARAHRIWRAQGNRCAALEHEASETAERQPSSFEDSRPHELQIVSAVASAFDLAYDPVLLGAELSQIIEASGCSPDFALRSRRGGNPPTSVHDRISLHLGCKNDRAWELVCTIPSDPLEAILLSDILRLGRAAVALERAREEERNRSALWPADPLDEQSDAIFLSEQMQDLLRTVRRIAPTDVPVLITGETGTGKEVLARTIHALSKRPESPFLPFNCTSTPKEMLDSQLFGHRRGAFTGATEHFPGVIKSAGGGTLFLDEIGDMGLDVQPKLLRFLESGEVHSLGTPRPTRVEVRVIAATNADLDQLVEQGRFRDDLFYRLSIVPLHIPPLRERRVEIPALAAHYLRKYAREYGRGDLRLAEETMEYLVLYRWPGNVRQLASEMRRTALMAEAGAVVMPDHLSPEIAASRRTVPPSERPLDANEIVVRLDQPLSAAMNYVERKMVAFALSRCDGRMEETAAMLGLSRKGLYLKRQRLGIEPPASMETAHSQSA